MFLIRDIHDLMQKCWSNDYPVLLLSDLFFTTMRREVSKLFKNVDGLVEKNDAALTTRFLLLRECTQTLNYSCKGVEVYSLVRYKEHVFGGTICKPIYYI